MARGPSMRLMKRTLILLSSFFVLSALWLSSLPVQASSALYLNLDALVEQADRVVVVDVESCTSTWGPKRRLIHTTCKLKVDQDVAGSGPAEIKLVQPGGQVGRWAQKSHGYHDFKTGQRLLLFLRLRSDVARVVGMSQGVFLPKAKRWKQAIQGLGFPKGGGPTLELDTSKDFERIRSIWKPKEK